MCTVFLKKNETNKIKYKIMPNEINWGTVGTNTASQVAGGLVGDIMNIITDKQQLNHQQALMNMQIQGQNQITDYNYQKQMQMWEDTNYSAQMKQLKKAGLNPGLIYKNGGAGGQTNVNTGNVTGATAPNLGVNKGMAMQLGQQATQNAISMENVQADTELKKANANLTNVQAGKTAGVDTELATVNIKSITQGIENQKAQQELTKVETRLKNIQEYETKASQNDRLEYITWNTKKAEQELIEIGYENNISSNTIQEKIKIIKLEAIKSSLQNTLIGAQTKAVGQNIEESKSKIDKMAQDILLNWKSMDIKERELKIQTFNAELKSEYPTSGQVQGKLINDLIKTINQFFPDEQVHNKIN